MRQYPSQMRKRGYITLIKPSRESLQRHRTVISKTLQLMLSSEQEAVIKRLNPIIRGWSNYYRFVVSSRAFSRMDHYIFQKLWKWSRWRHPNKGLRWIMRKYFRAHMGYKWRYITPDYKSELCLHTETPIKRHSKISKDKTPYDCDLIYWTKRFKIKHQITVSELAIRCM